MGAHIIRVPVPEVGTEFVPKVPSARSPASPTMCIFAMGVVIPTPTLFEGIEYISFPTTSQSWSGSRRTKLPSSMYRVSLERVRFWSSVDWGRVTKLPSSMYNVSFEKVKFWSSVEGGRVTKFPLSMYRVSFERVRFWSSLVLLASPVLYMVSFEMDMPVPAL